MDTTGTRPVESVRRVAYFDFRPAALGALVCFSAVSWGADFAPTIAVGLVHTDNISLSESDPQSELVLQILPSFTVTQDTGRLDADVAYSAEANYYDKLGEDSVYHSLDAALALALVPDNLFLNIGGGRSQAIADPEGPIPFGNLPITSNRIDRDDYYLGPSFQFAAGSNVIFSGDLRRTWVNYDDPGPGLVVGRFLSDYETDTGAVNVDNYRRESGFSWALGYRYSRSDYGDEFVAFEYREERVELGYWIGQYTRIFTAGGRESPWDRPLEPSPEDSFWEAGFVRTIADGRMNLEIAAGERSFGSSRRALFSYTFSSGTTSLSYAETPTSDSRDSLGRGGGVLPGDVEDFLDRPGSTARYISKLLRWNLTIAGPRTSVGLTLVDDNRENRTAADGSELPSEAQSGATVSLTRDLGARTDLVFTASQTRREFTVGATSDIKRVSLAANRQIGARSEVTLSIQRASQEDVGDVTTGYNYDSNLISILFSRSF
jgi:hypothetical protein